MYIYTCLIYIYTCVKGFIQGEVKQMKASVDRAPNFTGDAMVELSKALNFLEAIDAVPGSNPQNVNFFLYYRNAFIR